MNFDCRPMETLERIGRHYQTKGAKSLFSAIAVELLFGLDKKIIRRNILLRDDLENQMIETPENLVLDGEENIHIGAGFCENVPNQFEFTKGTYLPGSRSIYQLDNCIIAGNRGVVFYNDRIVLESVGSNIDRFMGRCRFLLQGEYFSSLSRVLLGNSFTGTNTRSCGSDAVFPLISIYYQGYYFWLLEYLPKLRAYDRYCEFVEKEPIILIQPNPPKYMVESLHLAGYTAEQIIEWDGIATSVDSVVLTQHRIRKFSGRGPEGFDYNPSTTDIKWVRDKLTQDISPLEDKDRKRIYISRQKAERERFVTNYDELLDALSDRGFESYVFEELPFEKQVELCNNAEIIIGPHGAGLTNMIFSESTAVIEIFNNEFLKSPFYLLADECGHDYSGYLGETSGEVNIHVDVSEFCDLVDEHIDC